jgi:hypothetical protein
VLFAMFNVITYVLLYTHKLLLDKIYLAKPLLSASQRQGERKTERQSERKAE